MSDEPIVELVYEKVFLDCPTVEHQTKKRCQVLSFTNFCHITKCRRLSNVTCCVFKLEKRLLTWLHLLFTFLNKSLKTVAD